MSRQGLFEAHGFRYHFCTELLRRSLQCMRSGLVGHESYVHDGAWSSRYFIERTMNPRCWHSFDDAILDTFVKRYGTITAHGLIGGKKQRNHVTKDDVSSPMVLDEAVMPTCITNAQEDWDVVVANVPNACTQTVTSKCILSTGK